MVNHSWYRNKGGKKWNRYSECSSWWIKHRHMSTHCAWQQQYNGSTIGSPQPPAEQLTCIPAAADRHRLNWGLCQLATTSGPS